MSRSRLAIFQSDSLTILDVIVFGPNGLELLATLVKISHAWDRAPMTVHYRITVPGGAWTKDHNGEYSIRVRARQVYGHSVAAGTIGTFTVNAPAPDYAGNDRQTAKVLGSVFPGSIRVALDWVSEADVQDYYKFTVTTRSNVSFKATDDGGRLAANPLAQQRAHREQRALRHADGVAYAHDERWNVLRPRRAASMRDLPSCT